MWLVGEQVKWQTCNQLKIPDWPQGMILVMSKFSNNESAAKLNYVSVKLEFKLTPVMIQCPVAPQFSFIRGAMLPISVCGN